MSPWTEIDSMGLPDSNSSLLSEDTVTVYVGRKRKKFHIHKALLCYHSSFFSKALDGLFKEHEDRAVYLPDDNVEGFVLFVNWMYNVPPQIASTPAAMMALLALYIMAEKFCIEELKNVSMDGVRASYRENFEFYTQEIEYIYDNTPESSPLRRFMADHVAYGPLVRKARMSKDFLEVMRRGGDFAADFASAAVQYSFGAARPPNPTRESNRTYHEHKSSKTCSL